jgi:hypothetical protein
MVTLNNPILKKSQTLRLTDNRFNFVEIPSLDGIKLRVYKVTYVTLITKIETLFFEGAVP